MLYIRSLRMTPAKRAPYGWCMGAIFVQKRWSRASLFFLEGIPPAWLLWYMLAGCIYIHTVTRTPAPSSRKRKQTCFQQKSRYRTETSWCNRLRLESASAGARHVFPSSYKLFSRAATHYYWLYSWLISCLVCRESANCKNINVHHVSPECIKCFILAEHQTKKNTQYSVDYYRTQREPKRRWNLFFILA